MNCSLSYIRPHAAAFSKGASCAPKITKQLFLSMHRNMCILPFRNPPCPQRDLKGTGELIIKRCMRCRKLTRMIEEINCMTGDFIK